VPMKAGQNRFFVDLLKPSVGAEDEYGHAAPADVVHASLWMNFVPMSGREYWRAAQVQSDVTHQLSGRWVDGVTTQMKARYGTRLFNIIAAINVGERNIELQLMCKEAA
jgi:SPP1 family predicted phage head-tail adaptor